MKRTENNYNLLCMIFAIALVTANCVASKVFSLPFNLFGSAVTLTAGAICYPISFLVTDIIGELWGETRAKSLVFHGFLCQIIATTLIVLARYLPATDAVMQESYVTLLGQSWVFVTASLVAYSVSQRIDVMLFHTIRNLICLDHDYGTARYKWIWNNCSTMISQLLDSVIYVLIAFGLGFGWLSDTGMHSIMFNMILAQWLVKSFIAALDTPIFYLCTKETN